VYDRLLIGCQDFATYGGNRGICQRRDHGFCPTGQHAGILIQQEHDIRTSHRLMHVIGHAQCQAHALVHAATETQISTIRFDKHTWERAGNRNRVVARTIINDKNLNI
jgi:hypothetical protein